MKVLENSVEKQKYSGIIVKIIADFAKDMLNLIIIWRYRNIDNTKEIKVEITITTKSLNVFGVNNISNFLLSTTGYFIITSSGNSVLKHICFQSWCFLCGKRKY